MNGRALAVSLLAEAKSNLDEARSSALQAFQPAVVERFRKQGVFGLGEAYIEGLWDCENLDELMYEVFKSSEPSRRQYPWGTLVKHGLRQVITNPQSGKAAFNIGKKHYDIGNDLFRSMLDESMTYTCGYWKNASTLNEAQLGKLDLVCQKLKLREGMRVLDIGCGWGNFAQYAAENYGVSVTGVTVSKEQAALARARCKGYPVEILLQDYRTIDGKFDRVVSLEMIEAVGRKNLSEYFDVVQRSMEDDALFLLQAISAESFSAHSDPRLDQFILWILKYIFPDGYLPKSSHLVMPCKKGLVIEDWHSFGTDYDHTLMAWAENFNRSWPVIRESYGEDFRRRWNFYLYSCAALFRTRFTQLFQIVYSKARNSGDYQFVR